MTTQFEGDFKAEIEHLYWVAIEALTAKTVKEALKEE